MSDITPPGANGDSPQPSPGGVLQEPRSVTAGRGVGWLREGFGCFASKPVTLLVMGFLFCVIMGTLSAIPLLSIIVNLLMPVFLAGFILAAKSLDNGEPVNVNYLYLGFKHSPSQLMLLGAFIGVGMMLIMIISFSFLGGAVDPEAMQQMAEGGDQAIQAPVLDEGALRSLLLAFLLLMFPLFMGVVFTIPMIVFHSMRAFDAIKMSYRASLRNMGAVGLFYALYTLLVVAATFPMTLGVAQAMQGNMNPGYLLMAVIGFSVLVPTMAAASYVGYREVLRA